LDFILYKLPCPAAEAATTRATRQDTFIPMEQVRPNLLWDPPTFSPCPT